MTQRSRCKGIAVVCAMVGVSLINTGCVAWQLRDGTPASQIPRELEKTTLPPYVVEPPDILLINAVSVVPKPPYRIESLDMLFIEVTNTLPGQPISGPYYVETEGKVDLGFDYGQVSLAGLTLKEAEEAIAKHLGMQLLEDPKRKFTVRQAVSRAQQQIQGEHLVRPDGSVGLGTYGSVHVAGLTLDDAKRAIEEHLSKFLAKPEITVDVIGYNSKTFYVITDGGGFGEQVVRLPITGNETVLDAISQISGLPQVASKRSIWIARPGPVELGCDQILPVDWCAITQGGATATNYQVFPGDRIYVKADKMIAFDNFITKVTTPFERMFGFTLLGNGTVRSLQRGAQGSGGFGGFGGF